MGKERLTALDALRGFALIGVVLVNAGTINGPCWLDAYDFAFQSSPLDSLVTDFSFIFLVEKFYPLFALIFGLSLALMLESNGRGVLFRRFLVLGFLGFLHVLFFFWGDILLVYAILGLVLLAISKLDHRKMLPLGGVLLLLTMAVNLFTHVIGIPDEAMDDFMIDPYGVGSLAEIMAKRLTDYYEWYYWGLFQLEEFVQTLDYSSYYLELLTFMVLGFALARYKTLLGQVHEHASWWLVRVVGFSFVGVVLFQMGHLRELDWLGILAPVEKLMFIALYSSGFMGLYSKLGHGLQNAFASAGRMTLTWYLASSALLSFVLHGNGLGLYGKVGPALLLGGAFLYLILCFFIGPLWLKKFGQGPLEKAWRILYRWEK